MGNSQFPNTSADKHDVRMAPQTHLSFVQKRALQTHQRQIPGLTQADLCRCALGEFGVRVARSTTSRIPREDIPVILNLRAKRQQKGRHAEMEKALFYFVLDTQSKVTLTKFILHQKANQLLEDAGATMKLSLAWVSRFKARHGIKSYRLHGDSASVELETLHQRRRELRTLLDGYAACDVFNMDETVHFYRMTPSRDLATMPLSVRRKISRAFR
uniref:HTH CENPB-type domain-containing protein n=1 Tax=Peronospora matthiolae TaxID=2874970 RepID=A0AAV1T6X1_9STRA